MPTVPETETRQERKERTRRAILDAALDQLAEESLGSAVAAAGGQGRWASCRPRSTGTSPPRRARPGAGRRVVRVAARDAPRRTPRPAARPTSIIDRSVDVLVEHVDASGARTSGSSPASGPAARPRSARRSGTSSSSSSASWPPTWPGCPAPRRWSAEDLRMLANLIVTAMVATAEAIMAPPAARRREADRRERAHPAADDAGRRAELAVPHLNPGPAWVRTPGSGVTSWRPHAPPGGPSGRTAPDVNAVEGVGMRSTSRRAAGRGRGRVSRRAVLGAGLAGGVAVGPGRSTRRGHGERPGQAAPPWRRTLLKGTKGKGGYRKIVVGPGEPHLVRDDLVGAARRRRPRPAAPAARARPAHRHAPDGRAVAGPGGVPRPLQRPGLAVRRPAAVPGRVPRRRRCSPPRSPRRWCGRCARSAAAR